MLETFTAFVICILTFTTCALDSRDRDPVHLQLILKDTGGREGGSGSGCSNVLPPPPVDVPLLHGDKHEKCEGNKEAKT